MQSEPTVKKGGLARRGILSPISGAYKKPPPGGPGGAQNGEKGRSVLLDFFVLVVFEVVVFELDIFFLFVVFGVPIKHLVLFFGTEHFFFEIVKIIKQVYTSQCFSQLGTLTHDFDFSPAWNAVAFVTSAVFIGGMPPVVPGPTGSRPLRFGPIRFRFVSLLLVFLFWHDLSPCASNDEIQ